MESEEKTFSKTMRTGKCFARRVAEAVMRSGWRLHAYIVMSNHYHLLVETLQANLVRGMSWLQKPTTHVTLDFIAVFWGMQRGAKSSCREACPLALSALCQQESSLLSCSRGGADFHLALSGLLAPWTSLEISLAD